MKMQMRMKMKMTMTMKNENDGIFETQIFGSTIFSKD